MKLSNTHSQYLKPLLLLASVSISQAALFWAPDSSSPNGEFTASTVAGTAINYGTLTLNDGVTMLDYAVVLNSASDLRYVSNGGNSDSLAVNNSFSVHSNGTADLYTAINANGHVDISIFTYALGSYDTTLNNGTALAVALGITAPNQSPNTETGSDMLVGNNVNRLNNLEELFSSSPITAVSSPSAQIETLIPGHPTNLTGGTNPTDGIGALPAGFAANGAFAWEASTGAPFPGGTLQVDEADFNVTYAATTELRLRRDTDGGANSAFGFAASVPATIPVPEPSSLLLIISGLFSGIIRRKR